MSNTVSSQRRMSVDVHHSMQPVARPPCSPITNEPPLRKKGSFSLTSFITKRSANQNANDPAVPRQPKSKAKKEALDLAAVYGADFARAVAANQFLNGGSLEDAIARVKRDNEKMARRRAEKYGVPYVPDAAQPVYGPNGEMFRDAQEESERRGLVRNAYKGMQEPSSSSKAASRGMRPEDGYAASVSDGGHDAPWASFQASSAYGSARAVTPAPPRRDSARKDFFASSFVPAGRA